MFRPMLHRACFAAALMSALPAFASSVQTAFDTTAAAIYLQNNTNNFSGWEYSSKTMADNGVNVNNHSTPTWQSASYVSGVASIVDIDNVSTAVAKGQGEAVMQMMGSFSLASGASISLWVPYQITLTSHSLYDNAQGQVAFEVKNTGLNQTVFNERDTFNEAGVQYHFPNGSIDSLGGAIQIDVTNTTGASANYSVLGEMNAYTSPLTSSVPEPDIYAAMLAGLGLLGFVARRRRG